MLSIVTVKRKIRKFLTYDLEWIPGTLVVRMVGVYNGDDYRCYRSVESFLSGELTDKNRGKWFYAHAGGLADIQFVLDRIIARRDNAYSVSASFSGSAAIIVHVTRGKNAWHFVDSYWLLRDKLKNIAKWVGMKKGGEVGDDEDLDDEAYEASRLKLKIWFTDTPFDELRDYNELDCVILWRAIFEFQLMILEMGGQVQMTLASTAMHLFRRKYLTRDIEVGFYANECARESYFASRVEVFERDVKNSYYYDINSSFPYAMTFPCPGEYLGARSTIPDSGIYIADVDVEIENANITPAPARLNGRVFFPSGKWRSWFTSIDIELILSEGGKISKVHEVLKFADFNDLSDYSKDLYEKRKSAKNELEKSVYKLLLNSLYGKFAESPMKSMMLINPRADDLDNRDSMEMLFPGVFLTEKIVSIPHLMVPVSAHITAIARRTLFESMSICGDFHYCDTDGFSTSELLSTSKNLGGLKLEKRIKNGVFTAPKLYHLDAEVEKDGEWSAATFNKAKGFSRMTSKRHQKLIEGESISYERMVRIKERYRSGFYTPKESLYEKRINIKSTSDPDFDPRKHTIPKRFTFANGRTRPWDMKELTNMLAKSNRGGY